MQNTMINPDDPLDFETEDSLLPHLITTTNKRKKVIGLDDLFNDHKEEEQNKKKKSKAVVTRKKHAAESDDDGVDETENKLTEVLHDFKKTIKEVDGKEVLNGTDGEDVSLSWGVQLFGPQITPTPLVVPDLASSLLFQNNGNNALGALVDYNLLTGEGFLRGLLLNGWLSKMILNCGYLEESIAKWTINLLLYSSDESLMETACEFWCAVLLCKKDDLHAIEIKWLPGFLELRRALESFGFRLFFPAKHMHGLESPHGADKLNDIGSDCKGPPTNIRAWIKFTDACFQVRSKYLLFSTLEAEELVGTLICLFLERQLLGLTLTLSNCLISAINFFEEKNWDASCEKVAKSLVNRVPRDSNCLRIIECISGVDIRSKQLRSTVASHFLRCLDDETTDAVDVLKFLKSVNLKNKTCDLVKIYIYLVLTENWILFNAKAKLIDNELWNSFIWKCSNQISNTDFRPCAQEIRTRAAYLLQSTAGKKGFCTST